MMGEETIGLPISAEAALGRLATVFHKVELEAALAQPAGRAIGLDARHLGQWGLHRVRGELYMDTRRANPEVRKGLKLQSDKMVRHARQCMASEVGPVRANTIADRLAASGEYDLFSTRAIQTIVSWVEDAMAVVIQQDEDSPASEVRGTEDDALGAVERFLLEFPGFFTRQEIQANLARAGADPDGAVRLDRRYALEAAPGVWIHRDHVDANLRHETRRAKEWLLAALPARLADAGGCPLSVAGLVAEFGVIDAFRRFSTGALATLICQFARQNRGYVLDGDGGAPEACRIAIASHCQPGLGHLESTAPACHPSVDDGPECLDGVDDFSSEDINYAEQKAHQLASFRHHHQWREDFLRQAEPSGATPQTNDNSQVACDPFAATEPPSQPQAAVETAKAKRLDGDTAGKGTETLEMEAPEERQRAFKDFQREGIRSDRPRPEEDGDTEGPWEDGDTAWTEQEDFAAYLDAPDAYDTAEDAESVDHRDLGDHRRWPDEGGPPEEDWEGYVDELDEFDADAVSPADETVQTEGRLSREQRARQVAMEIAQHYQWAGGGVDLLTEVFLRYGWSATRTSIERALESDMTPEELRLVMAVRELWQDSGIFSEACVGFLHNPNIPGFGVLSWPMALALVRRFAGLPDLCEIEDYLQRRFDEWLHSPRLHRRFPAFGGYLCDCVQDSQGARGIGFEWEWQEMAGRFDDDDPADRDDCYRKGFFRCY